MSLWLCGQTGHIDTIVLMAFSEDVPIPQGRDLQRRVNNAISDETGHLEEPRLDLDARSMAILGKRQQLSVRREPQRIVGIQIY